MGRSSSKTKYNYLNGIEGEAIEENAIKKGISIDKMSLEQMNELWEDAKNK